MPVFIKVSQNKIKDSKSFGKWYGRVVSSKTMSYQELCKHMSEHNSVYGEDVCLGVANKLQNCMLEQLLEGKKVQFGELGVFYLSVKSTGANEEKDFNLGVNINGLFLCFAPSRTDVNNLSSKMLKKKATFMNVKDLSETKPKTSSTGGDGHTESTETTENGSGSSQNSGGNSGSGDSNGGDSGTVNPEPSSPKLTISRSGSGSSSVSVNGSAVNSGAEIAANTEVSVSITPAEGTTPTANLDGTPISLTESEGVYSGTFQMPGTNATLNINSGGASADQN
jgi:predicted histone-like DNA-binding protein